MRPIGVALLGLTFCVSDMASFTSPAVAEDLRVELSGSQDLLRVVILNTSNYRVKVDTRLASGPSNGPNELYFDVRDLHGIKREYSSEVLIGPADASDWRDLWPHNFIGTQMMPDWIGEDYELDKGIYDITAHYRLLADDGHILRDYHSNTLRIEIVDHKQREARLKEAGEYYNIDLGPVGKNTPPGQVQSPRDK